MTLESPVNGRVEETNQAVDKALAQFDKAVHATKRVRRTFVALAIAATGAFAGWTINAQNTANNTIQTTLSQGQIVGRENHNLLKIVNSVAGPQATAASKAAEQLLIECLFNRVDVDTGHGTTLSQCVNFPG